MFVDSAEITIKSGKGGDGAVTFRREPFIPNGGPDGGNGGKGGNVVFVADRNLRTLMDFKYKRKYVAENGENGMKRNKYGRKGKELEIRVPVGTVISDSDSGRFMCDLAEDGVRFVAAVGGKGGLGNSNFKNSVRQAPNFAEAGGAGSERIVRLELKLIADVGLVGFPNVGKSTLLSAASAAKPKIADYHFTTIYPNLGVVALADTTFIMADIPGLIEGAATGAGLGTDFLKHIERTKILVHVVDVSGREGRKPLDDFMGICAELAKYSPKVADKPCLVACNKVDIADIDGEDYHNFIMYLKDKEIEYFPISAATKQGVDALIKRTAGMLYAVERDAPVQDDDLSEMARLDVVAVSEEADYRDINMEIEQGVFVLSGKQLKKIFNSTNFNDYGSLRYLYQHLVKNGVVDRMKAEGLAEGDTVRIYDFEFEYIEED